MNPAHRCLSAVLFLSAHLLFVAVPSPAQDRDAESAVDLYGDPLPPGATARLGTVRYRHGGFCRGLLFLPGARVVSFSGGSGLAGMPVEIFDASDGRLQEALDIRATDAAASLDGRTIAILTAEYMPVKRQHACAVMLFDVANSKISTAFEWTTDHEPGRIAMSPDGAIVVVAEDRGRVRFVDLASEMEILSFKLTEWQIGSLAFSPDGKTLATTTHDGVVLWDWAAAKDPVKLPHPGERTASVAFSPDGKWLAAACGFYQGAALWNVERRELVWSSPMGKGLYSAETICFTPDSRFLAVPVEQRGMRVELYEAATGKLVRQFDSAPVALKNVAVSSDGEYLAAAGHDGAFCVWRLKTGEALHEKYVGHHGGILRLAFSPDGNRVVSGGMRGSVRVWDAASGRELRRMQHEDQRPVLALAVSPDSKHVASTGSDDTLRMWEAETGNEIFKLPGHATHGVFANNVLGFTRDGTQLLSYGGDLYVRAWDVRTARALEEHAIRPSGLRIEVSEEGDLSAPDDQDGMEGLGMAILSATLTEYGGKLLLQTIRGSLHVFDTSNGREVGRYGGGKSGYFRKFAVSPDGGRLAVLERREMPPPADVPGAEPVHDAVLRIREMESQELLSEYALPLDIPRDVAYSADGKLLAIGLSSSARDAPAKHMICLWDVAAEREVGRISDRAAGISVIAFSPDGKRLACAQQDTTILMWDLQRFATERGDEEP